MSGYTLEELQRMDSEDSPESDNGIIKRGYTLEELKRMDSDPSYGMSGLKDVAEKYLPKKGAEVVEGWYNRSAARSAGGWLLEKALSITESGRKAVAGLERPKAAKETDESIADIVASSLGYIASNPGEAAVEMGKDFVANPELIGLGALSGARGARRMAEMAKLGKAGKAAAGVAGSAAEGAVVMGALDIALQLKNDEMRWKQAGSAAATGALLTPVLQGTIAGGQAAYRRFRNGPAAAAEAPPAPDLPPEHPGDINFDRPLTPEEAGTRTKAGKVKRPGQPYSSLREVSPEQKERVSRALEFEARNIQRQLDEMQPDEAGQLPPRAFELQRRLRSIEAEYEGLNREPSSPLARETVYGNEFGEFPEGKNPDLAEPNVQPGIDVAPFVAERRAQPLVDRIRTERQAQVDAGFRTKESDIEQAWQQHKAEQARAEELDARRESLADIEEKLTRSPLVNQKGAIDQDLLMKLGLGAAAATAGLYAYARPDQQKDIATAAAAVGGVLATRGKIPASVLAKMPERALGPLLADGKYTLKTLDRLPQNATEFHPAQVRQELNKPGTAAGEKAALEPVLARAEAEGRKVSAEELVTEFRKETGDHSLTPKTTDAHADFGVHNIRPDQLPFRTATTIWQFPETMHVSTMNPFGDPRYYGHTRSFREGGIEHVMEVQSDLAQNVRKVMTPEEKAAAYGRIKELETSPKKPREDLTDAEKKEWQNLRLRVMRDEVSQTVQDGRKGLTSDEPGFSPLTNAVKNAPNRLIRETLGQAAARGEPAVRFATADTVAKVEGWHTELTEKAELERKLERLLEDRKLYQRMVDDPDIFPENKPRAKEELRLIDDNIEAHEYALKEGIWKLSHPENRFQADLRDALAEGDEAYAAKVKQKIDRIKGHQSLYDRYAKETTSYLKSLGGKEVTDAQGHTWLEVPTGAKAGAKELADTAQYYREEAARLGAKGFDRLRDVYAEDAANAQRQLNELGVSTEPRQFGGRADTTGSGPINMYGRIEPDLAIKLGVTATGAALGGYLAGDEKLAGMLLGGIGGLAATRLPALGRSIGKVISPQQAFGTAVRISAALGAGYYLGGKVDHPVEGAAIASALLLGRKFMKPAVKRESDVALNIRNGNIAAWETLIHNTKREIDSQVPDPARREAITEALQVGARNSLAPNERTVFDMVTEMNAITGRDAIDAKVLRSLRENYITSILEFKPTATKTERQLLIDKIIGRMEARESAGSGTRFARQRKYDTFSELNRAIEGTDLQIKTKDVGEILELYTRSMRKAIEDRILIDFHKTAKATDGLPYVAKADSYGRFPAGFREIKHPQLKKLAVHPEAYDGLRAVLENYQPGIVMSALFGLSMAVKRSNVFGSLFHAKSLGEVYVLGMGSEMLPRPGDLKRPKRVIDEALKQFHEGGLGDHIEGLNRNGLKLEVPDDVSTTIIGDLGKLANTTFETKLGTAVTDKIDFVNKKTDKLTWDYMHAGVKSALALDAVAKFKKNNAELHAMNPEKYPLKSMDEIYAEAARYANDATGGLDWLRIATEAKTELGRSVAMNFASPRGRKIAQILLFAPDWTISTLRAGFNSFGKSDTGFRGLLKPTNAVDMYRRYALRSAALWLTVLNGIQYFLTGKSMLENDDPTRLQFSDGTSMQPGKHSAEAVHAAMDPVKFAMNKLGFVPSLGADLAAARWGAGPLAISGDSPTLHAVKKMAPFTASPMLQDHLEPGQRIGRSISGALGAPIYGMNPRQKMLARQERMREAARKRGER